MDSSAAFWENSKSPNPQPRETFMSTVDEIMAELENKGNPQRIKLFDNHGAPKGKMFGVSVADMKVIAKTIRGRQELAHELYETGNGDAMYLAGIVARGKKMSRDQINDWAHSSNWQMISEYTVAWVASESPFARELALEWIDSDLERVASSGWSTYAGHVTVTADDDLDLPEVEGLLQRIEEQIDESPNRVIYTMNGFVISVGSYVLPLLDQAQATAEKLGKVHVDMGGTACKVPLASQYIEKMVKSGRAGKKRKAIRC